MQPHIYTFQQLTTDTLYKILAQRNEVFILEQHCNYQDTDFKDLHALHMCLWIQNDLAAYCRILPPHISYEHYASIGRVLVNIKYRKQGYGKLLMQHAISCAISNYNTNIKISAQKYLLKFYEDLHFNAIGHEYLEDDIPHIGMIYHLK